MLTLSQTGSVFKPRKAHLPQELLGEVRPRRGSQVQPKTRLIAFGFWGFFLTSFQTWSKTTFLCSFTQVPKTLTLYHICLTLPLSLHLFFSESRDTNLRHVCSFLNLMNFLKSKII